MLKTLSDVPYLAAINNLLEFHILYQGSSISTLGPLSTKCSRSEVQMDSEAWSL